MRYFVSDDAIILCMSRRVIQETSRIKKLTLTWWIGLEIDSYPESLSFYWNLELEQSHILREEETLWEKSGRRRIVLARCHSSVAEDLITTADDVRRLILIEGEQRPLALPSVNNLKRIIHRSRDVCKSAEMLKQMGSKGISKEENQKNLHEDPFDLKTVLPNMEFWIFCLIKHLMLLKASFKVKF